MKSECLDRLIFFGERSLRRALRQWQAHYHAERNHQGLSNQLIAPQDRGESSAGEVHRSERLGGLLRYYHRRAA